MGCGTCSSGSKVSGCNNNGGCQTGGCNKMNVFDWLSNMDMPVVDKFNVVEVRFKGGHKEYFKNSDNLDLTTGDAVVVDVPNGHHIGHVSLQGELVRLQMQKKKVKNDDEIKKIYRIAHQKDLEKYEEVKNREMPTLYRARQIIDDLKLEMKLSDVEYQADNSKATFYYSAEDRVDFRELIKLLAGEFKIRVEMRQISLRQEAGRLGGIG
ncbi:MAG: PSP1 domain-containing protein, partial [Fulvivirga sp.]